MENKKYLLLAWGSVLVAILTAAKTAWELYTLAGNAGQNLQEHLWAIFWWFLLFVLAVAVAIYERETELRSIKNAKPIIKLKDFGFEIKTWKVGPPTVVAFIWIYNEPRINATADTNVHRLYPTVVWEDDEGNEVANNSGRWFIVNGDEDKKIDMQLIDLESSGMPRKMHFASSRAQFKLIETLWRDDGGNTHTEQLHTSDKYRVSISFRDSKNTTAKFVFRISLYKTNESPYQALRLEILDGKKNKFMNAKEFDFNTLEKFTKDNPTSEPLWK